MAPLDRVCRPLTGGNEHRLQADRLTAITAAMWIKICGITTVDDARVVSASGADAVGLNFYPPSKRYLPADVAVSVRAAIADAVEVVGVFVNASTAEVSRHVRELQLDTVQFHGDESADMVRGFQDEHPDTNLIRAFRIGESAFEQADTWLAEAEQRGIRLKSVLIDAYRPGEYGGTGHQLSTELVTSWAWPQTSERSLILAGGLKPDNVASAVRDIQPDGVDTASGVEDAPGRKNAAAVNAFVKAARG